MSFGKGSNSTTNTTAPNPQAMQAYQDLLTRASGVAAAPYQSYGGEMVAPINEQQRRGFAGINANAGFAQPYIQEAAGWVQDAANPISGVDIDRYMSPYTQQVVDATTAQFENMNAQQQQQVLGNAAAQGALGGDRVGVAQGVLAGQQQRAQAPVIAGLYSQGYTQALDTALRDRANRSSSAYALGNLGVAGQQAALSGAGAQVGAGSLEQQTQQAYDTAGFQEFLRQQAYPFQTAQWLAGLSTGVGSQMGGTSTTDPPDPNPWNQAVGLGLTAASMFLSDERSKENIERVGSLNDGQPIYRFNYKGDPRTQIGLIAQDVARTHPEAVSRIGGVGAVDYRAATDDAAERRHGGFVRGYDQGGAIGGMPYAGVAGYVPHLAIARGSGAPQAPRAAEQGDGGAGKMAGAAMDLADKIKGRFSGVGAPVDLAPAGVGGVDPTSPYTFVGPTMAAPTLPGLFRDGGLVLPQGNRIELRRPGFDAGGMAGFGTGSVLPDTFYDRFGAADDAIATGEFDPMGAAYSYAAPAGSRPADVPLPVPRPVVAAQPDAPETAGVAPVMAAAPAGIAPAASEPAMAYAPATAGVGMPAEVASPGGGGSGFFNLSPAARQGLLAAGLGIMASRSPNLGVAIGEGGLQGVGVYEGAKRTELSSRKVDADIDEGKRRLDLAAKTAADRLKMHTDQQAQQASQFDRRQTEIERANQAQEERLGAQAENGNFQYLGPTADGTKSIFMNQKTGEIVQRDVQIGPKSGTKEKVLPSSMQKDLGDKAQARETLTGLVASFDNNYGGFLSDTVADIGMEAARRGIPSPASDAAANWWSDYNRYKGVVRNKLFGSALTGYEIKEWNKFDAKPSQTPETIRYNIDQQKKIIEGALRRRARSLAAQGYSRQGIEEELGMPIGDVGKAGSGSPLKKASAADLEKARAAIKNGATREAVTEYLREQGYSAEGL